MVSIAYGAVYVIRNMVSERVYVGKSTNPKQRWRCHKADLRNGKHLNRHLQNAWKKYGEGAFVFTVIETADNEAHLNELECFYMEQFRSQGTSLYNIVEGGKGGFSLAAQEKARQLSTGRQKTPEEKAKWRVANLPRIQSAEYRQHLSQKLKGKPKSGYTITETVRAKWDAQRGRKELPEQTKHRIDAMTQNQPLRRFRAPDGTIYETRNVSEFAREHGLHERLLHYVVSGKQRHHRRWTLIE
jgi:group I intron endonuclease